MECACAKNEIEERLIVTENNLKLAKQLLRQSNDINLSKDLKTRYLIEQNDREKVTNLNGILFEDFRQHFDLIQIKTLRSVGPGLKPFLSNAFNYNSLRRSNMFIGSWTQTES